MEPQSHGYGGPAAARHLTTCVSLFDQNGTPGLTRKGNFAVDNVKRVQEAKEALDDLLARAEIKEQGNLRRQFTQLKHDVMSVVQTDAKGSPTINRGYQEALDKFASRGELPNAAELGAGYARGTEPVTERMFRQMSEGEKAMFRYAYQHNKMRQIGGKVAGPTTDFTGDFRSPNTAEELRTILPPASGVTQDLPGGYRKRLAELVKREHRMSGTSTKVLGNRLSVR